MAKVWTDPDGYEFSMARWSRLLNRRLVPWLEVPGGAAWLDVGCGTGALSQTLFELAAPGSVTGIDPSEQFVAAARSAVSGGTFEVAPAERLPFADASFDAAAAALCFHVMPDPAGGAAEMWRVLRPGGVAGATVWPATDGMEGFNRLWEAANRLGLPPRSNQSQVGDSKNFAEVFERAGFQEVVVEDLVIATVYRDFDDYWTPINAGPGTGRTEAYVAAMNADDRERLRSEMERTLPVEPDGTIHLKARALALRARKP